MNLNDILNNLKAGMQIPENLKFLKKYDTFVQNSIFEQEEIDKLKEDLIKFSLIDGNPEELTKQELLHYCKNIIDPKSAIATNNIYAEFVEGWFKTITGENDKIIQEVLNSNLFNDFSKTKKDFVLLFVKNQLKFGTLKAGQVNNMLITNFINVQYSDDELKELLPKLEKFNNEIPTFSFGRITKFGYMLLKDTDNLNRIDFIKQNTANYNDSDIIELLCEEPEFFEKIKSAYNIPDVEYLDLYTIKGIANLSEDCKQNLNKLLELEDISIKDFSDESFYQIIKSEENLEKFVGLHQRKVLHQDGETKELRISDCGYLIDNLNSDEEIELALKLFNIPNRKEQLSAVDIVRLVEHFSKDLESFIAQNPDFTDINYNSPNGIIINIDEHTEYRFNNEGLLETKNLIYDELLNITTIETSKFQEPRIHQISTYHGEGGFNNVGDDTPHLLQSEELNYLDENGDIIKKIEITTGSLKGLPNQIIMHPNGIGEILQLAMLDPISGARNVQKHFTSPDGTQTEYFYEETPEGTRILNYKITDKDGNILLDKNSTFHQENENKFISSTNGHAYIIEFVNNNIKVTDSRSKKEYFIHLGDKLKNAVNPEDKNFVLNMLKYVPPEQLIMMNHIPLTEIGYWGENHINNAHFFVDFEQEDREINIGKYDNYSTSEIEMLQNVFLHEFGHYVDSQIETGTTDYISGNEELLEIFKQEYENFIKYTTSQQQNDIGYLIHNKKTELVAESNLLLNAQEPAHAMRAMYLQQYFPRTIAKIYNEINERAGLYL